MDATAGGSSGSEGGAGSASGAFAIVTNFPSPPGPGELGPITAETQKQRAYDAIVPRAEALTARDCLRERAIMLLSENPCKLRSLQMVDIAEGLWVHVVLLGGKQRLWEPASTVRALGSSDVPRARWRVPDKSRLPSIRVEHNVEVFRRDMKASGSDYEELPAEAAPPPNYSSSLSMEANQLVSEWEEGSLEELISLPFDEVVNTLVSVTQQNSWVLELQDFQSRIVEKLRAKGGLPGSLQAPFDRLENSLAELLGDTMTLAEAFETHGFRIATGSFTCEPSQELLMRQIIAARLARVRTELAEWRGLQRGSGGAADVQADDTATSTPARASRKRVRTEEAGTEMMIQEPDVCRSDALVCAKVLAANPGLYEARMRAVAKQLSQDAISFATFTEEKQRIDATSADAARAVIAQYQKAEDAARDAQLLKAETDAKLQPFVGMDNIALQGMLSQVPGAVPCSDAAHTLDPAQRQPEPTVGDVSTEHKCTLLLLGCIRGLPQVTVEMDEIHSIAAEQQRVCFTERRNPTAEEAASASAGSTWVHFAGHADPELGEQRVLAFLKNGGFDAVDAKTLIDMFRDKELVVLNGCQSSELGTALSAAGVRNVVCWDTKAHDLASRLFAVGFWTSLMTSSVHDLRHDVRHAFEHAKEAVLTTTKPGGSFDNGLAASVPKFELVDPDNSELVDERGRLLPACGASLEGRLAAGEPLLLQKLPDRLLVDVPSLPQHYVPRPHTERPLRDLMLGQKHVVTITATTSISGTAGLGKTTIATWLARDVRVQTRFPDGIYWLRFGQEASAMSRLRTLAAALGMMPQEVAEMRDDKDAVRQLKQRLDGLRCLLVCDDVWCAALSAPIIIFSV